jgi:hypothetical protein
MLKWILGISALIAVAILAVLYNPSYLWVESGTKKKPLFTEVDDKMRGFCKVFFKDSVLVDGSLTPEQYDTTCLCFANEVFETTHTAPSVSMDRAAKMLKIQKIAQMSVTKCVNQTGTE